MKCNLACSADNNLPHLHDTIEKYLSTDAFCPAGKFVILKLLHRLFMILHFLLNP